MIEATDWDDIPKGYVGLVRWGDKIIEWVDGDCNLVSGSEVMIIGDGGEQKEFSSQRIDDNGIAFCFEANAFKLVLRFGAPCPENFTGEVYNCLVQMRTWLKDGELHREDGPALINSSGKRRWYLNDNFVELDGHTAICFDVRIFS